jgi:hypothetical protein
MSKLSVGTLYCWMKWGYIRLAISDSRSTIFATDFGSSKCFPCSSDSFKNNLSMYPSSKTTCQILSRKILPSSWSFPTKSICIPSLVYYRYNELCGARYKRHGLPDFLACTTINDIVSPARSCTISFCDIGQFGNIFRVPMMRNTGMVTRHQSFWQTHVIVVCWRNTTMERLHKPLLAMPIYLRGSITWPSWSASPRGFDWRFSVEDISEFWKVLSRLLLLNGNWAIYIARTYSSRLNLGPGWWCVHQRGNISRHHLWRKGRERLVIG